MVSQAVLYNTLVPWWSSPKEPCSTLSAFWGSLGLLNKRLHFLVWKKKREQWGTLAKTNENTSRSNYCWLVRKLRWKKKHDVLGYLKVMLVWMDSSKNHLTWMFRGSEQVFHGMLTTSFMDEHLKNIFRKPETLFFICICQDQIKVLTFTDSQTSPSLLSSISPCIKPDEA